jgi:hypothetical protein
MGVAVTFKKIDSDESWEIFNDASMRLLGMPAEELVRKWDAGEFSHDQSVELTQVLMLRPSGR